MSSPVLRLVVQSLFTCQSRATALRKADKALGDYLALAEGLSPEAGQRGVRVPPMRGVDEEMRDWSFYQLLEHNTIVNRVITKTIESLVQGRPPRFAEKMDPKRDVLPSEQPGAEQVERFAESVRDHVSTVAELGPLRGTITTPHPLFGVFDAHKWTCMFAFHLAVHLPQAEYVVREAKGESGA